jgi:hypothetical protein
LQDFRCLPLQGFVTLRKRERVAYTLVGLSCLPLQDFVTLRKRERVGRLVVVVVDQHSVRLRVLTVEPSIMSPLQAFKV